jgi:cellulose synthase/poly-beta-1,6-N-acetylglucosamine synthase-like glycosyltransferase
MNDAANLIGAVLRLAGDGEAQAGLFLNASVELGVDPLDYCAHRFGLDAAAVWERAAAWAGLAFFPEVPAGALTAPPSHRLDALANARTAAGRLYDRRVLFAAPRCAEFVALRRAGAARPDLVTQLCIVPPARLRAALVRHHTASLMTSARQRLTRRWPTASASIDLGFSVRLTFLVVGVVVMGLALAAPFVWQPVLMPIVTLLLMAPAMMRLLAAVPGLVPPPLTTAHELDDAALPVYSVLVPLRNEVQMVPNLARALGRLDYPPEKLDIKFVVEARSHATVAAVEALLCDPRFELVAVPDETPRTKPKALNYALPFVRGEHLVVFDAEDVPDPSQLRQAASLFSLNPEIDCLQAELVIDNAEENWLATMFAGEYAGLFGLMLPALAHWRLPMPLGGTSNHFRVQALRELGGWDAYNVTEDADLGVRLARLRYRSASFASRTSEEAPITLKAWMAQRTRWMKGWMQTFIVHTRHPLVFIGDIGWRGFLAFELYVGSLIVSALLHTVFLVTAVARFGLLPQGGRLDLWGVLYMLMLVVGYGGAVALVVAGLIRLQRPRLLILQLTLPLYWVLHSAATLRAAHELLTRPFFWAKTEHGKARRRRGMEAGPAEAERRWIMLNREPSPTHSNKFSSK